MCLAETDKRKVQKRHACLQTRNIVLGRYPTGSGARTVVACEPPTRAAEWETARAASPREPPPSPPRGAPPVHAPTRFSSRDLKVPLASRKLRDSGISQWDLRSSHWEVAAFPVGSRGLPSGKSHARAPRRLVLGSRTSSSEARMVRVDSPGCRVDGRTTCDRRAHRRIASAGRLHSAAPAKSSAAAARAKNEILKKGSQTRSGGLRATREQGRCAGCVSAHSTRL